MLFHTPLRAGLGRLRRAARPARCAGDLDVAAFERGLAAAWSSATRSCAPRSSGTGSTRPLQVVHARRCALPLERAGLARARRRPSSERALDGAACAADRARGFDLGAGAADAPGADAPGERTLPASSGATTTCCSTAGRCRSLLDEVLRALRGAARRARALELPRRAPVPRLHRLAAAAGPGRRPRRSGAQTLAGLHRADAARRRPAAGARPSAGARYGEQRAPCSPRRRPRALAGARAPARADAQHAGAGRLGAAARAATAARTTWSSAPPSPGRPAELPGVETMVGLFINTLPVRVRVPPASAAAALAAASSRRSRPSCASTSTARWSQVQGWSEVPRGHAAVREHPGLRELPASTSRCGAGGRGASRSATCAAVEQTNYPLDRWSRRPGERAGAAASLYDRGALRRARRSRGMLGPPARRCSTACAGGPGPAARRRCRCSPRPSGSSCSSSGTRPRPRVPAERAACTSCSRRRRERTPGRRRRSALEERAR